MYSTYFAEMDEGRAYRCVFGASLFGSACLTVEATFFGGLPPQRRLCEVLRDIEAHREKWHESRFTCRRMRTRIATVVYMVATLAVSGCSNLEFEPGDDDALANAAEHDTLEAREDRVLVSLSSDIADELRRDWQPGALELVPVRTEGDIEIVELARIDVAELSNQIHARTHRCGGFIAHDSMLEAVDSALHYSGGLVARRQALTASAFYEINQDEAVRAAIAQVDDNQVLATIEGLVAFGTRYESSRTAGESAAWLAERWRGYAAGRSDVTVELVDHNRTNMPSVAMTIRGSVDPGKRVIIGGHLDSIVGGSRGNPNTPAPGADDDASGVAALGEAARVMLATNFVPDYSVTFYAYAAEEIGLVGSGELAAQAEAAGDEILGVMQLDMVNFNGSSIDMGLLSDSGYVDSELNSFLVQLIEAYTPYSYELTTCGYGCSDHASWSRRGYPAVAPFEAPFSGRNRSIHTTGDTIDRSNGNASHAGKFARVATAFLIELSKDSAGTPDDPTDPPDDPTDPPDDPTDPPDDPTDPPQEEPECRTTSECAPGQVCTGDGECVDQDTPGDDPPGDDVPGDDPPGDDPPGDGPGPSDPSPGAGCNAGTAGGSSVGWLMLFALIGLRRRRRR